MPNLTSSGSNVIAAAPTVVWIAAPARLTTVGGTTAPVGPRGTQAFRKSTFSAQGNCVEVAILPASVLVRDSKHPSNGALAFTSDQWREFVHSVQSGHFDAVSRQ